MSELIYGPNTEQVTAFIERCKVLTGDEIEKIADYDAAWSAARDAVWDTARDSAWYAARDAARSAVWDTAWDAARYAAWSAARDAAWSAAWDAAWDAAGAIVLMDLITAEQFAILTEPFAEILMELGIVWKENEVKE